MARLAAIKASRICFQASLLRAWPRSCCSLDERLPFIWNAPRFPPRLRSCFRLKNQGLAFQRAAARAPNVLPLYGTSELITPSIPERASLFFAVRQQVFKSRPLVVQARTCWSCCKKSAHSARTCVAKTCHLAFTRLVFEGQVRTEGLPGEFLRRWELAK